MDRLNKHLQNIEEKLGSTEKLPSSAVDPLDWHLNKIESLIEGGGGTTNYDELENKPSIAGNTLEGDLSLEDLGIQNKLSEEDIESGTLTEVIGFDGEGSLKRSLMPNPELAESILWADLKAKRDAGELVPGKYYRITDYTCTTTQYKTSSAGHVFDIIVVALENNKLSEEAWAAHHEGDTYFANSNLSAWKLWYCLDNDYLRFEWADNKWVKILGSDRLWCRSPNRDKTSGDNRYAWIFENNVGYTNTENPTTSDTIYTNGANQTITEVHEIVGKGIVYRMIDEFNNDCPYDFKNILFTRDDTYGTYTNAYTFTSRQPELSDNTVINEVPNTYNVFIGCYINSSYYVSGGWHNYQLPFIVAIPESYSQYGKNTNLHDTTITQSHDITLRYGNSNIIKKTQHCILHLTESTVINTSSCKFKGSNIELYNCLSVTMNNFNATSQQSKLDGVFYSEISSVEFCTLYKCQYMKLPSGAEYSILNGVYFFNYSGSLYMGKLKNVIIDPGTSYITIQASGSGKTQNIHIHSGISGASSSNPRTINVTKGLEYSTDIYAANSKTIILDD